MTYDKDKETKTKSQFMRSIIVLFSKHFHCNFYANKINRQCPGITLRLCLSLSIFYLRMELLTKWNARNTIFNSWIVLFPLSTPEWWMLPQHAKVTFQPYIPIKLRCRFFLKNLSFFLFDSVSCYNCSCFCTRSCCLSLRFTISVSVSLWHCLMQPEKKGNFLRTW